jgi:LPXTG-site transpeptidase (sortase) family protein
VVGNSIFFSATDNKTGYELWRSDPPYEPASAFLVADINPEGDSLPGEMTGIGTSVFFSADDGVHGRELWRSDQPYHSAVMVEDIFPGGGSSTPHELHSIGWMLFFFADDSTGPELWRSDPPYSAASTFRQTRINQDGNSHPQELTRVGLNLFFSANDGTSGQELYVFEPPYNEAVRVTDITGDNPKSSNPTNLYAIGDTLFFSAEIGLTGVELFRTDPPYDATTTYLVKDINIRTPFGTDNLNFNEGSNPEHKMSIGSTLFFTATDGVNGVELYKSDPPYQPESTHNVRDIFKGPGSSSPRSLTAIGTTLFFVADDGKTGLELWKVEAPYDHSLTELVKDILPGPASSNPHNLAAVGRTLFFSASTTKEGAELWRYGGPYSMPATGFAPNRITQMKAQPVAKAYQAMNDLRLEIPSLQVNASIVGVPVSADGWDLAWLSNQLGYLDGTAFPSWAGNSVLTAHVYLSNGKPGPFVGLSQLKWGDNLVLTAYGQRFIYEVRSIESVKPQDTEAVFKHEDKSWITLVTCQGYDEELGDYRARLVARAVLVKVEPKK